MLTAVAIAQLAQQGKLSFDDTLAKLVPDYPNKEVAGKITIHQLLTHTSGMGSYFNDKYQQASKTASGRSRTTCRCSPTTRCCSSRASASATATPASTSWGW